MFRKKKPADAWRMDLDEIKRLLYVALSTEHAAPAYGTEHYELAGTLINALRHHQGIDPPDLEARVIAACNGDNKAARDLLQQVEDRRVALARSS